MRKRTYEQIKVDENNCSPRSSPTDPPQVKQMVRIFQLLLFLNGLCFSVRSCFWTRVATPETFHSFSAGYAVTLCI